MAKTSTRSRAGMDADAVRRMMAEQEQQEHDETGAAEPVEPQPAPTPPTYTATGEPRSFPVAAPAPRAPEPSPVPPPAPEFDPGRVDGRTLRRTGREPFATRIKPETHQALRRIAYHRGITIAEALEMAVAAFERG